MRRAVAWQPVAAGLAAWSRVAGESRDASVRLTDLKKAIDWLRATGKQVRNARLAPFAATSARVWERLRQESNVELGPIMLAGAGYLGDARALAQTSQLPGRRGKIPRKLEPRRNSRRV
jgi:hypothetical protein